MVDGSNYDPPGIHMFLARLIVSFSIFNTNYKQTKHFIFQGIIKMMIIICIVGSVNIFNYINQPQPSWWQWCINNKLYSCLMIFFLVNIIEGELIQSGAFEISLNDVPVWSKLETGRIPQPAELFQIIDNHMQFSDKKIEFDNGFAK